jgi:hypothetical protein
MSAEHQDEDAFLRKLILPQEDCMRLGILWYGGYRWFRSPNVVPIEQWRRKQATSSPAHRARRRALARAAAAAFSRSTR